MFGEKTGRTLLAAVGIAAALLSPATVLAGKGDRPEQSRLGFV